MWKLNVQWSTGNNVKCTERTFYINNRPSDDIIVVTIKEIVDSIKKRMMLKGLTDLNIASCTLTPCCQEEQIPLGFLR